MSARATLSFDNLPPRLTTAEVCELAKCSVTSLWRRRRQDPTWLPASPVQLGKSTMFDRDAVLRALGLFKDAAPNDQWTVDVDAIRAARARKVRNASAARRRDVQGPHGSARKAPALRLVSGDPSAG